jgi:hypothetical protein
MATNSAPKKDAPVDEVKEDWLSETSYKMDHPVLDPTSDLAVQVPEGTESDSTVPLAEALKQGTPEEVFEAGKADKPTGWTE